MNANVRVVKGKWYKVYYKDTELWFRYYTKYEFYSNYNKIDIADKIPFLWIWSRFKKLVKCRDVIINTSSMGAPETAIFKNIEMEELLEEAFQAKRNKSGVVFAVKCDPVFETIINE